MFGSDILEVAIGLILMFLLFSLLMTAARETLESMLKRRGRDLQNVLVELLGKNGDRKDSANEKAAETPLEAFQRHPLIYALFRGDTVTTGRWTTNAPSYIPSMAFASAVMDLVQAGQKLPADSAAARAYETFIRQSGESSEKVKAELAAWFDGAMDRMSGAYRRHTQRILFWGGLVFAVALNFNAVVIAKYLSVNQTARESIVRIAGQTTAMSDPLSGEKIRALDDAVRAAGLPIGWSDDVWRSMPMLFGGEGVGGTTTLELALGYLAFALAATLGAPFWFDLLGKVIAIRSTMKPDTTQSATAPPPATPATPVAGPAAEAAGGPVPDRLSAPEKPFVYG